MSEVYFIGDLHFGHKGILNFSGTAKYRDFYDIEAHDEELIKRWNSVVNPKDMVWVLGDFCFGKRNLPIAGRLNGNKKLVMGNHDMYATEDYLKYFTRLCGVVEYKGLVLSHVPVHPNQLNRWYMNVHGHLHEKLVMKVDPITGYETVDMRYVNVSAEQINLTPIPYDEVLNQWAECN